MNRRNFLEVLGLGGAILAFFRPKIALASSYVTVYDITMEGWSTLGSGFLGDDKVLTAAQIVAYKQIDLPYTQDDHGHHFTITTDMLSQILLAKTASTLTTYALDHRHEVRIKQSRRDMSSEGITIEIDENGIPIVPV